MQSVHTTVMVKLNSEGVYPDSEWLHNCIQILSTLQPKFSSLSHKEMLQLCFAQFLHSDMNMTGGGGLTEIVKDMDKKILAGKFLVQIDEVTDVSSAARERYTDLQGSDANRCLKLSLTDGQQRVAAIEYQRVDALSRHMAAGVKAVIFNVPVRKGLLLLSNDNTYVLGGRVQSLEEARVRMVERWNKPPRGLRGGSGGRGRGVSPSVAAEATAAAWPESSQRNEEETVITGDNTNPPQTVQPEYGSTRSVEAHALHSLNSPHPFPTFTSGAAMGTKSFLVPQQLDNEYMPPKGSNRCCTRDSAEAEEIHAEELSDDDSDVEILNVVPSASQTQLKSEQFDYLATLFLTGMISGVSLTGFSGRPRVKCVVAAVKQFELDSFKLLVAIEDGTKLCTARVDTKLLEKLLGISCQDARKAMKSSEQESERVTMVLKKMEPYLSAFEGVVELEWDELEKIPVIVSMVQGIGSIDPYHCLEQVKRHIT